MHKGHLSQFMKQNQGNSCTVFLCLIKNQEKYSTKKQKYFFLLRRRPSREFEKSGLNNAVTTLLSPYMKKSWGGVRGQQHCYWQKASNLSKSPCSAIRARFMALTPISAVARKLPIFDRRLLFRTFLARLKTLLFCNEKKNNTSNYWGFYPCFWQF